MTTSASKPVAAPGVSPGWENPLGSDVFGQGNFRALFVSMERDQLRRGVPKAPEAG